MEKISLVGLWLYESRKTVYEIISTYKQRVLNIHDTEWTGSIEVAGDRRLSIGPFVEKNLTEEGDGKLIVYNRREDSPFPVYRLTWNDPRVSGASFLWIAWEEEKEELFQGAMAVEETPGGFIFKDGLFSNDRGESVTLKGMMKAPEQDVLPGKVTILEGAQNEGFPLMLEYLELTETGKCRGIEYLDDIVSPFDGEWQSTGDELILLITNEFSSVTRTIRCSTEQEGDRLLFIFTTLPEKKSFEQEMGFIAGSLERLEHHALLSLRKS